MTENKTTIIYEPGKQEIVITREFNAPRERVFEAYTDAGLYVQWVGPKGLHMNLDKFDPKSGGSWRYVHKGDDGSEYAFHGVYHDVTAPERIIDTFEYEGIDPGHVILETVKFEELPEGRTKLTILDAFQSVADRDGMIQNGLEKGVTEGFDRLETLLQGLQ